MLFISAIISCWLLVSGEWAVDFAQALETADFGKNPHGLVRSLEDEQRTRQVKEGLITQFRKQLTGRRKVSG